MGHWFHIWTRAASAHPRMPLQDQILPTWQLFALTKYIWCVLQHQSAGNALGQCAGTQYHTRWWTQAWPCSCTSLPCHLQGFDVLFSLILCKCLELLEYIKNVQFGMNWNHKVISWVVINECNPISISKEYLIGNLVHIRVDKLKRVGGTILKGREWICMHLAS